MEKNTESSTQNYENRNITSESENSTTVMEATASVSSDSKNVNTVKSIFDDSDSEYEIEIPMTTDGASKNKVGKSDEVQSEIKEIEKERIGDTNEDDIKSSESTYKNFEENLSEPFEKDSECEVVKKGEHSDNVAENAAKECISDLIISTSEVTNKSNIIEMNMETKNVNVESNNSKSSINSNDDPIFHEFKEKDGEQGAGSFFEEVRSCRSNSVTSETLSEQLNVSDDSDCNEDTKNNFVSDVISVLEQEGENTNSKMNPEFNSEIVECGKSSTELSQNQNTLCDDSYEITHNQEKSSKDHIHKSFENSFDDKQPSKSSSTAEEELPSNSFENKISSDVSVNEGGDVESKKNDSLHLRLESSCANEVDLDENQIDNSESTVDEKDSKNTIEHTDVGVLMSEEMNIVKAIDDNSNGNNLHSSKLHTNKEDTNISKGNTDTYNSQNKYIESCTENAEQILVKSPIQRNKSEEEENIVKNLSNNELNSEDVIKIEAEKNISKSDDNMEDESTITTSTNKNESDILEKLQDINSSSTANNEHNESVVKDVESEELISNSTDRSKNNVGSVNINRSADNLETSEKRVDYSEGYSKNDESEVNIKRATVCESENFESNETIENSLDDYTATNEGRSKNKDSNVVNIEVSESLIDGDNSENTVATLDADNTYENAEYVSNNIIDIGKPDDQYRNVEKINIREEEQESTQILDASEKGLEMSHSSDLDTDTSALMKLAELACSDSSSQNFPTNDSVNESMEVDQIDSFCKSENNQELTTTSSNIRQEELHLHTEEQRTASVSLRENSQPEVDSTKSTIWSDNVKGKDQGFISENNDDEAGNLKSFETEQDKDVSSENNKLSNNELEKENVNESKESSKETHQITFQTEFKQLGKPDSKLDSLPNEKIIDDEPQSAVAEERKSFENEINSENLFKDTESVTNVIDESCKKPQDELDQNQRKLNEQNIKSSVLSKESEECKTKVTSQSSQDASESYSQFQCQFLAYSEPNDDESEIANIRTPTLDESVSSSIEKRNIDQSDCLSASKNVSEKSVNNSKPLMLPNKEFTNAYMDYLSDIGKPKDTIDLTSEDKIDSTKDDSDDDIQVLNETIDHSFEQNHSNLKNSMKYICKRCKEIWNDETLKLLFQGSSSVTVKSRITNGSILCMCLYADRNFRRGKYFAVKSLVNRAEGNKFPKLCMQLVYKTVPDLISKGKIKCCDVFKVVMEIVPDENEIVAIDSQPSVAFFDTNLEYINEGPDFGVRKFLEDERASLPVHVRPVSYETLHLDRRFVKLRDNGKVKREMCINELLSIYTNCFNSARNASKNEKLLYDTVYHLMWHRGKALLLDNGSQIVSIIKAIMRKYELVSNGDLLPKDKNNLFDKEEVFSAPAVAVGNPKVKDVLAQFCLVKRNFATEAHLLRPKLKKMGFVGVDDYYRLCINLYNVYTKLLDGNNIGQVTEYLNVEFNFVSDDKNSINLLDISKLSTAHNSESMEFYVNMYSTKFRAESEEGVCGETNYLKVLNVQQKILSTLPNQNIAKKITKFVRHRVENGLVTKEDLINEHCDLEPPTKKRKVEDHDLLKNIIGKLLKENIRMDDLHIAVKKIYSDILKLPLPPMPPMREILQLI